MVIKSAKILFYHALAMIEAFISSFGLEFEKVLFDNPKKTFMSFFKYISQNFNNFDICIESFIPISKEKLKGLQVDIAEENTIIVQKIVANIRERIRRGEDLSFYSPLSLLKKTQHLESSDEFLNNIYENEKLRISERDVSNKYIRINGENIEYIFKNNPPFSNCDSNIKINKYEDNLNQTTLATNSFHFQMIYNQINIYVKNAFTNMTFINPFNNSFYETFNLKTNVLQNKYFNSNQLESIQPSLFNKLCEAFTIDLLACFYSQVSTFEDIELPEGKRNYEMFIYQYNKIDKNDNRKYFNEKAKDGASTAIRNYRVRENKDENLKNGFCFWHCSNKCRYCDEKRIYCSYKGSEKCFEEKFEKEDFCLIERDYDNPKKEKRNKLCTCHQSSDFNVSPFDISFTRCILNGDFKLNLHKADSEFAKNEKFKNDFIDMNNKWNDMFKWDDELKNICNRDTNLKSLYDKGLECFKTYEILLYHLEQHFMIFSFLICHDIDDFINKGLPNNDGMKNADAFSPNFLISQTLSKHIYDIPFPLTRIVFAEIIAGLINNNIRLEVLDEEISDMRICITDYKHILYKIGKTIFNEVKKHLPNSIAKYEYGSEWFKCLSEKMTAFIKQYDFIKMLSGTKSGNNMLSLHLTNFIKRLSEDTIYPRNSDITKDYYETIKKNIERK